MANVISILSVAGVASVGALIGLAMPHGSPSPGTSVPARTFTICHTGGGANCVVDGDTAWIDGMKVRVADIDAPETHPPRCPHEAELRDRATTRLAALMNAGPFTLASVDRDEDRYGRKLRVLIRDGRSLGDQLVGEGLARTWDGRRHPWC
jgi:endonuclease YncB( thermonuclease family)